MTDEQEAILEVSLTYLKNGSVPCVCIRIKKEDIEEATSLCVIDKLFAIGLSGPSHYNKGEANLWVSKRQEYIDILSDFPSKPTKLESYGIAKLLGYGDDVIFDMISKGKTKIKN